MQHDRQATLDRPRRQAALAVAEAHDVLEARPRLALLSDEANTSVVFTSVGSLSTTAKNARRSDTVARTVFGRARDTTNAT